MPYTPAHAICAAPLWHLSKKRLPLPALVIGCIAPDLPYFIHLAPVYSPGHTITGLVTHALPQGLLALGMWYLWLEKPVLALFALQPSKRQVSGMWFLLVVLSLLLGATSHALLDATSHQSGWFVQRFDWLSDSVGGFPIFKWIQYGGGVLGLGGIAGWYGGTQKTLGRAKDRLFWMGTIIFTLSILALTIFANWIHQSGNTQSFAVNSASGAMSGFVVGACIYTATVAVKSSFR